MTVILVSVKLSRVLKAIVCPVRDLWLCVTDIMTYFMLQMVLTSSSPLVFYDQKNVMKHEQVILLLESCMYNTAPIKEKSQTFNILVCLKQWFAEKRHTTQPPINTNLPSTPIFAIFFNWRNGMLLNWYHYLGKGNCQDVLCPYV
jgi:hypothetical protein